MQPKYLKSMTQEAYSCSTHVAKSLKIRLAVSRTFSGTTGILLPLDNAWALATCYSNFLVNGVSKTIAPLAQERPRCQLWIAEGCPYEW